MPSRTDHLLDRVGVLAREQARAEAQTTLAMLEFADARRAEYEAAGPSPHHDLELCSIADELAIELQLSVTVVQNRLHPGTRGARSGSVCVEGVPGRQHRRFPHPDHQWRRVRSCVFGRLRVDGVVGRGMTKCAESASGRHMAAEQVNLADR